MPKRRISKASKRRLSFFGTMSILAIIYFFFILLYNSYTIYDLTVSKKDLENSYVELLDKAEQLKIDIEKLNDPKYLADYAREHYLYSKDGEYIIQIVDDIIETTETIDSISIKLTQKYAVMGLCFILVLIFLYIIIKGKKCNKKKSRK